MTGAKLKFPHKMIEEVFEEPQVAEAFLSEGFEQVEEVADEIGKRKYEMLYITGSGTSYHAGLAAQYAISSLTRFTTSLIAASEFPAWIPSSLSRKSLLIAVSQSGESGDVLAAARAARSRGIDVLAVTNTANSSLTKLSHCTVLTRAGPERAITATKSHIAQLIALFSLSTQLALKEGPKANSLRLKEALFRAPKVIGETIESVGKKACRLAEKYSSQNFFFILGSGSNYPAALEGALKLKEACNMFAEGFASREFLHGPIQLVDKRTSLFFLLTEDQIENALNEVRSIRKFGGSVFSVVDSVDERLRKVSSDLIRVSSDFPKVFSSLIYIIPLQLFAYYSSVARGLNPDKPEKLTKVVK
jgi:glucosamine--fructose-6-phosphate aminotransferase (isomerizing)